VVDRDRAGDLSDGRRSGYADGVQAVGRDIIVLGGSAGAIGAAQAILADLPSTLPACVFLALHRGMTPDGRDAFTPRLAKATALVTSVAADGEPFRTGHAYVAPFDHHLLLEHGVMRLEASPKEMFSRPCVDVLFKSAAACFGRRVIGVLLSGGSPDGTAGLWHIKKRGGIAVIQDPAEAKIPAMPESAIDSVSPDFVLPASEIAAKIEELSAPARETRAESPRILIVEDESVVATSLQRRLAKMEYDVIDWVPTGEAAIERAEQERPDLILMDIHLAGSLNGIDAARCIWEKLQIPVVYCTAHADVETLRAVQATESYGYVVKPFQSGAVRAAIQLALARREKELR
jgi:chemotaxis response regulator CheB